MAAGDVVVDFMQQTREGQLNMGIAYYCGFSHSAVGLLPDAEERRQRVDADGQLLIDAATFGAERAAQYADLERRADGFVAEFLAAEAVPARI
ncbi:hypothetical protein [Nocardia seriolae]|uniref:hypothetical protein n=1 Tax=Nocardia seriolae TaxID=37332 RepID=UPI001D15F15B|nr:hypothetical protein [Nocardia seriolae]WNJ60840.1 hypothetical protein RMO66_09075 [Nocardia seriolae]